MSLRKPTSCERCGVVVASPDLLSLCYCVRESRHAWFCGSCLDATWDTGGPFDAPAALQEPEPPAPGTAADWIERHLED